MIKIKKAQDQEDYLITLLIINRNKIKVKDCLIIQILMTYKIKIQDYLLQVFFKTQIKIDNVINYTNIKCQIKNYIKNISTYRFLLILYFNLVIFLYFFKLIQKLIDN